MKAKIVSISELTENNPTLCLSAYRVLGDCHKCDHYIRAFKQNRTDKLRCNPQIINEKALNLLALWQKIRDKHRKILRRLNEINEQIEKS